MHDDEVEAQRDETQDDAAELKSLLASLAAGVRAASGLPTTTSRPDEGAGGDNDNDNHNNDREEQDDTAALDEFAFQASLPAFATALHEARDSLSLVLKETLDTVSLSLEAAGHGGIDMDDTKNNTTLLPDVDDPFLWEQAAEACESLLEQVETYLQNNNNNNDDEANLTNAAAKLKGYSQTARHKARSSFADMMKSVVDMPKPQETYGMQNIIINNINDRHRPFVPAVHPDKPHGTVPLSLALLPGHGLDTRHDGPIQTKTGATMTMTRIPKDVVAPHQHAPHPYAYEIQSFVPEPDQLAFPTGPPPPLQPPAAVGSLKATWIDTPEALQTLAQRLEGDGNNDASIISEIALDLEAHSIRSFAGIVCLAQLSFRNPTTTTHEMENYLIDTLALQRSDIRNALAAPLANPRITKIMHGADSDIPWLQRDFGLYVVNLFDTGRAARALELPSVGYAALLSRYSHGQIIADKSYQLADWRQRPLSVEMRHYAIQDTHYLLDVARHVRFELNQHVTASIEQVVDASRQVSLIRYAGEPFRPSGYEALWQRNERRGRGRSRRGGRGRGGANDYDDDDDDDETQKRKDVLKALWDWRDATARRLDESPAFCCAPSALWRVAVAAAKAHCNGQGGLTLEMLQRAVLPTRGSSSQEKEEEAASAAARLIESLLPDMLECVQRALQQPPPPPTPSAMEQDNGDEKEEEEEDEDDDDGDDDDDDDVEEELQPASSSAFFKPTQGSKERHRRGMMSPVLGTEALYKQAGWLTPQEQKPTVQQSATETAVAEDSRTAAEVVPPPVSSSSEAETGGPAVDAAGSNTTKPRRLLSVHASNKHFHARHAPNEADAAASSAAGVTAQGMATVLAAREAARPGATGATSLPRFGTVQEEVKSAQHSSTQIRIGLNPNEAIPAVLGLIPPSTEADDDDGAEFGKAEAQTKAATGDGVAGTTNTGAPELEEEEFVIPRSMREIYKISNRNRRYKKAGSPTPERGVTPTNEKDREELAKADALIRERGFEAAGFLFDNIGDGSPGKRPRTKSSGRESEESVPADGKSGIVLPSREDDLELMRREEIGWLKNDQSNEQILAERYGAPAASPAPGATPTEGIGGEERAFATAEDVKEAPQQSLPVSTSMPGNTTYDYNQVGAVGAAQLPASNPFFTGAALQGGQLYQPQQQQQRQRKGGGSSTAGRGKQSHRRQERPEKKDGRTQAYRSKR